LQNYQKLLKGLENVGTYIDDIVIHTPNEEGHQEVARNILDMLHSHLLTARPNEV